MNSKISDTSASPTSANGFSQSVDCTRGYIRAVLHDEALEAGQWSGLALSRPIVVGKRHGTLTYETELGIGTTFHAPLSVHQTQHQPGPEED